MYRFFFKSHLLAYYEDFSYFHGPGKGEDLKKDLARPDRKLAQGFPLPQGIEQFTLQALINLELINFHFCNLDVFPVKVPTE